MWVGTIVEMLEQLESTLDITERVIEGHMD